MFIMALAMMLVPVGDALSKSLTPILNPFEIAFWRFLFQSIVLAGVIVLMRRRPMVGPWWLLLLGGATAAIVLGALIGAFAVMPIATAIAIFFVEPLLLTVMSGLILRESTGWRRYAAVAVGLVGALIVIRPSWDIFGWASLLPLLAALAFATNAIVIRKLSQTMDSLSIQFWFAFIAMALICPIVLLSGNWTLLTVAEGFDPNGPWVRLIIMGFLSALTFFLISEAFRRTPAGTLAPFQYLEIVGATVLGYVFFGDFPDFWTWVGTAIILGSGLYVFHRERRAGGAPQPTPPSVRK